MLQVGINPVAVAAVVALSQLSQFPGAFMQANLGAAQLSNGPTFVPPPPAGGSPSNNSSRRGRRAFRGNGRGYNRQCLPQTGDRGTGPDRGRGGPRCFQQHGALSASQQEPSSVNVKSTDEAQALAVLPKEMAQTAIPPVASHSTAAEEKDPSRRRPPQSSLCELCRVECNSLEMLEEHKNGKRHKRNLQKTEESKSAVKPGIEKQNGEKPAVKPENEESQQANRAPEREEKKSIENELVEPVGGKNSLEPNEKHTETIAEEAPRSDCFHMQGCGMNSKMQDQEGKCKKTLEAPKPKVRPCKQKVVIPLICDLCNVKCNTQEVFDCHLSGKKHTAKLKRSGPVGLQVLYPPDTIGQMLLPPQGNQQQPGHIPQDSKSCSRGLHASTD